jgi:NAD(P)-dependent dehydrogenase (short-subunit alcohol dehydrogenase family)
MASGPDQRGWLTETQSPTVASIVSPRAGQCSDSACGTAKLENILFTRELHRRFHDQGINAAAFHPGVVAPSFASDTTHLMRYIYHSPLKRLFAISAVRGAEPLVWLAEGTPGTTWRSRGYYEKNKPAATNAQADDPHLAQQLWDRGADMLKL